VTTAKNEDFFKIIQGCIRKSEKSQELLYKKFFGYALSIALIYNSQRNDALEVVDDSFVKVFTEIEKFDESQSFKGWLRKIVINTSIDLFRKNHKKNLFVEAEAQYIQDETPNIISHLTAQDIIELLNRLPHVHKIVFSLYEIEGFSHEEIAQQLYISESSSRVYLTRAKKQLRELFPIYFKTNLEKNGN
jgi:RNA polymerase sigma factor (sigma-70 family)